MKSEFKIGDKAIVFQDTKSRIGGLFGLVEVTELYESGDGLRARHRVRYLDMEEHDYHLWVHPDDMRLLTPLEELL